MMFVTHKPFVKMEISKGWTHGCAFSWDQNLDFMFSSGHKKKIGKRHLSLTKFRLCGTCWQDSGVWNCDMTKFLHSQKCDNYYVFQYFNSSLGGSMGLSSYSGLIKHEWIKLVENISNRYIVLSIFLYYLWYLPFYTNNDNKCCLFSVICCWHFLGIQSRKFLS